MIYYRIAVQTKYAPTWRWMTTKLTSLHAVLNYLQTYRCPAHAHLRIFFAVSVEALEEMLAAGPGRAAFGGGHAPVRTVPRQVIRDVEFAGYMLPAGTPVRLALAAGHHLPGVFADPEVFDPDRFAPPREEDKRTPYGLVTFGGGPRLCIGVHFANIEVKAIVAQVLRAYRLGPLGDQPPEHNGLLATFLPNGVHTRVLPRSHAVTGARSSASDTGKPPVSTDEHHSNKEQQSWD